ncbi:efflux RND transporter periplasmic adaptor subunit [Alishewanella longhuensis]
MNGDEHASSRHFVGRIDAVSTVDLAFQVGGRVIELPVQQGQIIPAGELLAELDPTDYQLALQQAEVQLEQARRDLERAKPLREQGILTPSAFDQLQTNYEIARVACKMRSAMLTTQLMAPFDALINRRLIERYSTVGAARRFCGCKTCRNCGCTSMYRNKLCVRYKILTITLFLCA